MEPITKYDDYGNRFYQFGFNIDLIDEQLKPLWLPSVTSITDIDPVKKRIMSNWVNKKFGKGDKYNQEAHEKYMKITREVGELIHLNVTNDYIHLYPERKLNQKNPEFLLQKDLDQLVGQYKDHVILGMILFNKFKKEHNIIPEAIEVVTYNTEVGYAGRCDFKGYYNGKKILFDIKTSKKIYTKDVGMQLEAYNQALGGWADELYCLRIRPFVGEDDWEFVKIEIDDQWNNFLKLLKKFKEKFQ